MDKKKREFLKKGILGVSALGFSLPFVNALQNINFSNGSSQDKSSGWEVLLHHVADPAEATVDLEPSNIGDYKTLKLIVNSVQTNGTSGGYIYMRLKIGGTYITSGYFLEVDGRASNSTYSGSLSSNQIDLSVMSQHYNTAYHSFSCEMTIHRGDGGSSPASVWHQVHGITNSRGSSGRETLVVGGYMQGYAGSALTGIRIYHSVHGIKGNFTLLGLKE